MKKVGILTFHASHNYGSVLQAYALSSYIKNRGFDVEVINLRNKAQKEAYRLLKFRRGLKGAANNLYMLSQISNLKRRYRAYETFINKTLPVSVKEYGSGAELAEEPLHYDTYVCGSDQIWNPACQDFEPAYYLDFVKGRRKTVAYAPSLGKAEFNAQHLQLIKSLISNIDCVSVREEQGAKLLQSMTDKTVSVVCDPVLLLDSEEWKHFAKLPSIRKPYILTYYLENNHGSREYLPYLRKLTGYTVVSLNEYLRDAFKPYHHAFGASPQEFVGLFMDASLILTNSFHGTAFATIFQKPFFTAAASDPATAVNNNDSRKYDYLTRLGLEGRILTNRFPEKEDILTIDYKNALNKLAAFRDQSIQYLKQALEVKQ